MNKNEVINKALTNGITYDTLIAYIDGLHAKGELTDKDYNEIILYILANGNLENSPRDLIQIMRGNQNNLPALAQGEFGFCLDTEKLYIGGLNGNVNLNGSWLAGKTINVIGDSISSVGSIADWPSLVAPMLGCTINNYSVAGITMTGDNGIASNIIPNLPSNNPDVNILFAGTNDHQNNVNPGTRFEQGTDTIYGAYVTACRLLTTKYPNAINFMFLPMKKYGYPISVEPQYPLFLVDTIAYDVGKRYGFSIVNLWNAPEWNPEVPQLKDKWSVDGLHPNELYTVQILAPYIAECLASRANHNLPSELMTFNINPEISTQTVSVTMDVNKSVTYTLSGAADIAASANPVVIKLPPYLAPSPSIWTSMVGNVSAEPDYAMVPTLIADDGEISISFTRPVTTLLGGHSFRSAYI